MTSLRIFMVSSDGELTFELAKLFQKNELGCCVGYANTEAGATRWLAEHPTAWDIMIADTSLEDGSGLSVLSQCPPPRPNQKIVMLSYLLTEKMKVYCRTLGADLTLDKTHGFEQLMAKLGEWSGQNGGNRRPGCPTPQEHECELACC